jgi:hypothetical protein
MLKRSYDGKDLEEYGKWHMANVLIIFVNLPVIFNVTTMYWLSHFNETQPGLQLFTNLSQIVVGTLASFYMSVYHASICDLYERISTLNNDISEYGVKCKEQTETSHASSHENVDQPSFSKSVYEPSSSRSITSFQPMDRKSRKRRKLHYGEDKTEPKRVEEERISMDLVDNDGEESVVEPVNTSESNFPSKVEDFLEYVEKNFKISLIRLNLSLEWNHYHTVLSSLFMLLIPCKRR